jgi:hypothetical protein
MPSEVISDDLQFHEPRMERRERYWQRTPGFRDMPRGELPIQPYEDSYDLLFQEWYDGHLWSTAEASGYHDPPGFQYSGQQLYDFMSNAIVGSDFVDMANATFDDTTLKLLGSIADQKVNLPVLVAEAHKTADMILGTATKVVEAYRAFVRGNFKQVAKVLNINPKSAHKSWLEYKYGWMPMLMDIKGVAETFAQRELGGRPIRFSVTEHGSFTLNESETVHYLPYGGSGDATYKRTFNSEYRCTQKLWLEVDNPQFTSLQQMGLTNPLLVAWELVPYSFVIDWACSVGDWLKGLTALQGLKIVKGFRSNVNTHALIWSQPETRVPTVGTTYVAGGRHWTVHRRRYSRSPFSIVDGPPLPTPRIDLGFQKLVTSLALLRGQMRGFPRKSGLRL